MPRKRPYPHTVQGHRKSNGTGVPQYNRGSGLPRRRRRRVVVRPERAREDQIPNWILENADENLLNVYGTPKRPLVILDENIDPDVAPSIERRGAFVIHVREIFKRGTPDSIISVYAEKHNAHVVTKDTVSFPEPRTGGDRILIRDVPKREMKKEVVVRLRETGVIW